MSANGDDGNDGSTSGQALRTMGAALGIAEPGVTIHVMPGSYSESFRGSVNGEAGRRITLAGESTRPVLTGSRSRRAGLWFENSSHLVIENLEIEGFTDIGIVVERGVEIDLRDLVVHDNGFQPALGWVEGYGLHVEGSSDIVIAENDVFRNGPDPRPWNGAGTGINTFGNTGVAIRDNLSYENHGGGILVEDSFDVLVEGNQIYRNDLDVSADEWWDGGIWLDGGGNVTLRNNTLWDNLGPGIEISDEECQGPTGYVMRNNTSTGNYFGIFIWNFATEGFPPDDVLFRSGNNFSGNQRQDVWIQGGLEDCP